MRGGVEGGVLWGVGARGGGGWAGEQPGVVDPAYPRAPPTCLQHPIHPLPPGPAHLPVSAVVHQPLAAPPAPARALPKQEGVFAAPQRRGGGGCGGSRPGHLLACGATAAVGAAPRAGAAIGGGRRCAAGCRGVAGSVHRQRMAESEQLQAAGEGREVASCGSAGASIGHCGERWPPSPQHRAPAGRADSGVRRGSDALLLRLYGTPPVIYFLIATRIQSAFEPMATSSLLSRPIHLIAVLWFLVHIPTTLLVDIQSSMLQQAGRTGRSTARHARLSAAAAATAAAAAPGVAPTPCTSPLCSGPTPGALLPLHAPVVLPPHLAADFPQWAKDMLQWHIKTNGDHLVRQPPAESHNRGHGAGCRPVADRAAAATRGAAKAQLLGLPPCRQAPHWPGGGWTGAGPHTPPSLPRPDRTGASGAWTRDAGSLLGCLAPRGAHLNLPGAGPPC
jgi:hypothetical protein